MSVNSNINSEHILKGRYLAWVLGMVGAILLLAGSIFGVDWMNYFYQIGSLYPAIAKPFITLLAMVLVLGAWKYKLSPRDWWLLFAAFACMLPTDILMSLVVVSPTLSVGSSAFMIGGVLSILAHIFLIVRVSRGLPYLKDFYGNPSSMHTFGGQVHGKIHDPRSYSLSTF